MTELDYGRFEALTFDCYGTLIDWEAGILAGLRPVLAARGVTKPTDDELLEKYAERRNWRWRAARTCATARSSARCLREVAADYAVAPDLADVAAFVGFGREVAGIPRFGRCAAAAPRAFPARRHHQLRRRPVRAISGATRDRLRLGRHRTASARLQAEPAQFRGRARAHRVAPRQDPARGAEPLPRPRAGQEDGLCDGLDRSPGRAAGVRGDAAGQGKAGRDLLRHGVLRGGGDRGLTLAKPVGSTAAADTRAAT